MNLTSPACVRSLLSELGVRPNRTLGQNFLVDGNTRGILIEAAGIGPRDEALEIGPGLGVLTESLVDAAKRVVAIEKDHRLADHLQRHFAGARNLTVICADALTLDLPALMGCEGYKLVSNLPYASGTRILVDLIRSDSAPASLLVTVQREVADRMGAAAGSAQYGLLSVWMQLDYTIEILRNIRPTCFWPRPEVSSAIVRGVRKTKQTLGVGERDVLFAVTKHAFSCRRKQMSTVLRRWSGMGSGDVEDVQRALDVADVAGEARPQDVPLEGWCRLAYHLHARGELTLARRATT